MTWNRRTYQPNHWQVSNEDKNKFPVQLYRLDVPFSFPEEKTYIAFFAYARGKIYRPVKISFDGREYIIATASFTGFSTGQSTLYVRDVTLRKDGAIGSILPENLFNIVEDIVYCYNENIGVSTPKTQGPVGLDDKLFTVGE